ncbi:hypothetical protein [Haloferax sp. DFSO60]|uniref:hypothetical protein n=1 Tax=Haloferax sp. DFSO60 TaxID=3388652 RepID=UPI00397BB8C2
MNTLLERSRVSTRTALLVGVATGLAVVGVYTVSGLLIADWSLYEFFAHLSPGVVGYLVGMVALVTAVFGFPVLAYLRFGLTAPLVVLTLVLLLWLTIGVVQGVLSLQTSFGLALYAVMFSPIYLVLYGILGGGEYLLRTKTGIR